METQTFSKKEKEEIIRYGLDRIKSTCTMTLSSMSPQLYHMYLCDVQA